MRQTGGYMTLSFFRRFKDSASRSFQLNILRETSKDAVPAEATQGQEDRVKTQPAERHTNHLFSFVDFKDPFADSEIAGEEQIGPILSIMTIKHSTRRSSSILHTQFSRTSSSREQKELTIHPKRCRSETIMARVLSELSNSVLR